MLLHVGEQNVRSPNSSTCDLEEQSTARLEDGSIGDDEMKGHSMDNNEDELQLSESHRNTTERVNVQSECNLQQAESVSPRGGTSLRTIKSSSQAEECEESENKLSVNTLKQTDEDKTETNQAESMGLKQGLVHNLEVNLTSLSHSAESVTQKKKTLENDQHFASLSKSEFLEPLVSDVENDQDLQEKWYLTFEQFVSVLQQEPDLCQFFAEQNAIDLTGSSVDPLLSHYTRTVLASSP